jgi:hypothetical protein
MQTTLKTMKYHPQLRQKYDSGIYRMKCLDYPLKYVGQTGRIFHTSYKEHIQVIRSNKSNSRYSKHVFNTGHKYGTLTVTMDIIRTHSLGKHLNTLEKISHIEYQQDNLQVNDTNTDIHSPIFKALQEKNAR